MTQIVNEDIEAIISSNCIDWGSFNNCTVLISGANGMLPSYMALVLLKLNQKYALNIRVVCVVRNIAKAKTIFADYLDDKNLEFIVQDICKPLDYTGEIHYIIHAASQASPKYYGIDPVGTASANLIGTINLLELARNKNVKSFLFFSSGGIYGNLSTDNDLPVSEDIYGVIDPLKVRSCYFESKRMAENLCVDYNYQYGVPTKIVRIFHTLGPNMDLTDGRAFSDFCKAVVEGKDIVLKSDGKVERCFCYITDAVVGYFKVLIGGENASAYNVGNPHNLISIKNLAYLLARLYENRNISVRFEIDNESVAYFKMKTPVVRSVPSVKRLERLGWTPTVSVSGCFRRVIDSKISEK